MKKSYLIAYFLCFLALFSCTQTPKITTEYPKLSLQLHSVRDQVSNDFEQTLKQVAKMGFAGVEFAGRYGPYENDPKGLREFLQNLNLDVSGAHVSLSQLQGEQADEHLRFFAALDAKLIIIPYDKRANQVEHIDALVADLTAASLRANQFGLQLGYHNHALEFDGFQDATFWDYLAQNTPENVVLQLDVGWVNFVNKEPADYIKRYPNRTLTTHYKVRSYQGRPGPVAADTKVIIGQDPYNWEALIKANMKYGGTQWIVVEQEEYPEPLTPLQSVEASLNGLQQIIDGMNDGASNGKSNGH